MQRMEPSTSMQRRAPAPATRWRGTAAVAARTAGRRWRSLCAPPAAAAPAAGRVDTALADWIVAGGGEVAGAQLVLAADPATGAVDRQLLASKVRRRRPLLGAGNAAAWCCTAPQPLYTYGAAAWGVHATATSPCARSRSNRRTWRQAIALSGCPGRCRCGGAQAHSSALPAACHCCPLN